MQYEKLQDFVNAVDVVKLTSEMIKIPSYSFMDQQEAAISQYIYDVLKAEGVEVTRTEIAEGRFNVTARLAGTGEGPSLMLSGHIDTVPPYDFAEAFSGRMGEDRVYGRGACDMKGPVAAMMAAMIGIKKSGMRLKGDLIFTGVADEEEQAKGTTYLVQHGPYASATIVGEPTKMKIALGHKGLEWIDVEIIGKKVHGGDKQHGINAVVMATRFIQKICDEYEPILNMREYPRLGAPTINIGSITGGDQPSTVPGSCTIRLDRRCVPTETIQQVYDELEDIAKKLHEEDPKFKAIIRDTFEGDNLLPHEPFCTDKDQPIVKAVQLAKAKVENGADSVVDLKRAEEELTVFPAWTDAGFINVGTDSVCLVMGPGDLSVAHSTEEHILIEDLKNAALVYANTALIYCGANK